MNTLTLLEPKPGATTPPLQAYAWTGHHTYARDPIHLVHAPSGVHTFDRGMPRPIRLSWRDTAPRAGTTWRVVVSRQPDLADPILVAECHAPHLDIHHLFLDTCHYWQVSRDDGIASPIESFRTHALPPRWIHVPGITNVRDLGGWPLPGGNRFRQGLVYRSSELNGHLTIHDAGRRVLEDELGIRTDLDLRGEGEDVRPVLDERRVRWINAPIRPYGEIIREQHHALYRRIFELFAESSNYPILFHCWGGADRAGTVAFMLHALLDGYPEHLALDYELTTMAVWQDRHRFSSEYRALLATLATASNNAPSPRAQVEHYLHTIGVTSATITAIRTILIEAAVSGLNSEGGPRPPDAVSCPPPHSMK